jgi:hypothetical protein
MHTNKTQNTKHKTQNTKHKTQNTKNKSILCVFCHVFIDTFFQQQQQKKSYIKMTTVHP